MSGHIEIVAGTKSGESSVGFLHSDEIARAWMFNSRLVIQCRGGEMLICEHTNLEELAAALKEAHATGFCKINNQRSSP